MIKHIHTYKKNTLLTHFWFINDRPFTGHIDGINNSIYLWSSSFWARKVYPVFKLSFDKEDKLINIEHSINKFGKFTTYLAIGLYVLVIIYIIYNAKLTQAFTSFLVVSSLVLFILIFLPKSIYRFETGVAYKKLCDVIGIDITPTILKKKEAFTFSKVLSRLILYPLSLILIFISCYFFFPEHQYKYGILGILIGLSYLVSDILLIIIAKKRK